MYVNQDTGKGGREGTGREAKGRQGKGKDRQGKSGRKLKADGSSR